MWFVKFMYYDLSTIRKYIHICVCVYICVYIYIYIYIYIPIFSHNFHTVGKNTHKVRYGYVRIICVVL
jgi:hypothetical protein